jgi:transposase-like protein
LDCKSITTDDAKFMERKLWTAWELRIVIDRYPNEGPQRLANELQRSKDAVSGVARRVGLKTRRKPYRRQFIDHQSIPKATPSET